jgi:predicted nucleotidyltransferase
MKTPILRDRDLAVLRDVFLRFPCVREVRLFGSRATGHARRASDIDLAISAPVATAEQWLALTEALESAPVIYDIDLVRAERTENARLLEKIRREGVPIYSGGAGITTSSFSHPPDASVIQK